MITARILLLLLPLSAAVLPVAEQKRPSTSRLSRGPEQPSLAELAAMPAARETAEAALAGHQRVAIVPLQYRNSDLPAWAAPQALDVELAGALRYAPQWILDSPTTVRRLVGRASRDVTADTAAEVARQLSADELIFIGLAPTTGESGGITIDVEHWTVSASGARSAAPTIRHRVTESTRRTAVAEVARQLMPPLPPEVQAELMKPGTTTSAAHVAWAASIDNVLEAITSDSPEQAHEFAERGLEQAEEALATDPGYVPAALAAAACLELLDRQAEQPALLKRTYAVRNTQLTDGRTMQEFTADYHRITGDDPVAAFTGYLDLLEQEPGYLPALWSLLVLELFEADDAAAPSSEDLALMGDITARVLLAHPHSRIAEFISHPGGD